MSLLFDSDYESTPQLRRQRKRFYFIFLPIFFILVGVFTTSSIPIEIYLEDRYNLQSSSLWNVSNLYLIVKTCITVVLSVFYGVVVLTLLATWLKMNKSNLLRAIVENLNNGKGLDTSYYAPEKNDRDHFYQADDQKLEIRVKVGLKFFWFMLGVTAIPTFFFALHVYADDVSRFDAVLLFSATAGIVIILYNACLITTSLSFNRLEGTFTYFGLLLPWHRKIAFNKVQLVAYMNKFQLFVPYRFVVFRLIGEYKDAQAWWSYYVWYMDRNRPLPPGTLFDAYREKDYLRRKAEGFPAPLYESSIDTPEWEGATSQYNDPDVEKRNRTIYAGSPELAYQYVLRKSYLAQHTYMVRDIRQRRK